MHHAIIISISREVPIRTLTLIKYACVQPSTAVISNFKDFKYQPILICMTNIILDF